MMTNKIPKLNVPPKCFQCGEKIDEYLLQTGCSREVGVHYKEGFCKNCLQSFDFVHWDKHGN